MQTSDTINELGIKYLKGSGVPVNYSAAMNYFKKAAHMGNLDAMINIGNLYRDGLGVVQNNYEALGWYKAAADKGNVEAAVLCRDIPNHNEMALSFYEKAANEGYEAAIFPLACLYEEEYFNFGHNPKALEKALENDELQKFIRYNFKAFKWYKKAAEYGNIEAMFRVGRRYEENYNSNGKKNENELSEALEWYFKAADAGHHQEAMFRLAEIFESGCYTLIPRDEELSWYWYRRAADAGHYGAMYKVGYSLHWKRQYSKAFEYFFKAANAGHYPSMLQVGIYYATAFWGRGARNIDKARQWLSKVANCGIPQLEKEAVQNLREINAVLKEIQEKEKQQQQDDCFITTAVCQNFGKPDDCYELTEFRKFRDTWLINQPDGEFLIEQYYIIAPKIVEKINMCNDAKEIYSRIWEQYLFLCLNYIEEENYIECKNLYVQMVNELSQKF